MADYGILFLSKMFMERVNDDEEYITPVRHVEGSLTFGFNSIFDDSFTTVTEYLDAYDALSELKGTGYDTTLFLQTVLMMMCTADRLIAGTITNVWTMQCYDNFVADIYLTEQDGIYSMLDLFTWEGIAIAYAFMTVNSAVATISTSLVSYMTIYLFYLIKINTLSYGEVELMTPIYDWGWFGDAPFTITI